MTFLYIFSNLNVRVIIIHSLIDINVKNMIEFCFYKNGQILRVTFEFCQFFECELFLHFYLT